MSKGLMDALYWRLHTTYLTNERQEACRYLEMLQDEISKGQSLIAEIGQIHYDRFKKIANGIKNKTFGRITGLGTDSVIDENVSFSEKNIQEKQFCEDILKEEKCLLNAVGCSPNAIITTEIDVQPYGRIDIRFAENRVVKILEVKAGKAHSSLVSQIDKYRVALELDFCLGLHDSVEAYVLASGYDKYVLSELTRVSVVVLLHNGTPESIKRIA